MNTLRFPRPLHLLLFIAVFLLVANSAGFAASRTWTGTGSTNNFSNQNNWNGSTDINSGDSLTFNLSGSSGTTLNNNLTVDWTVAGMTFSASASAYTMGGNAITLSGNVANNNTATQTINLEMTLSGTRTFTVFAGSEIILGSRLKSTGGLTKAGAGILTLNGDNTYDGDTTVTAGILRLGAGDAVPGGASNGNMVVNDSGILDMNGYGEKINGLSGNGTVDNVSGTAATLLVGDADRTTTFSGAIKNTGGALSLEKIGAGTLTLSGSNSYSGDTLVSGGGLTLGNKDALSGSTLNTTGTGILSFFAGTNNLGGIKGGGNLGNGGNLLSVGANNQSTTYSGVMSGSGGLTKVGTGTLTLSGTNTYGGDTTVSAGTLKLGAQNVIPNGTGKGNVNVAGVLDLNAYSGTLNGLSGSGIVDTVVGGTPMLTVGGNGQSSTFSGVIRNTTGTLSLTKIGTGTLALNGANSYSGDTLVSSGGLTLGNQDALSGSTLDTAGGGTVSFFAGTNRLGGLKGAGSLDNGGNLLSVGANNQSTTYSGVLSGNGGLTKAGTGTLTLSGNNTYGGDTTVSAGTVKLEAVNVIPNGIGKGNVTVAGTLDLNAYSATLNGLSGSGIVDTVAGGTPTLTVGGNDQSSAFGGMIRNTAGSLTLIKTGTGALALTGSNTFTGGFTLNAGTILVGNNSALGGVANAVVINAGTVASSDAVAHIVEQATTVGGDFTLGQSSGGTGALTLTGTMNLGGATRQITVDNGADTISGVITDGGLIKAGSGALALTGSNTFADGFTLNAGAILVGHASALGSANVVVINAGTVASFDDTAYTLGQAMTVGGNLTLGQTSGGTGELTLTGTMDLGGVTRQITVDNSGDTISGVITNGGVSKAGSGALTLTGSNTFAGGLSLNAGTLLIGHASALGSANVVAINGGVFASSDTTAYTIGQATTVGGNFTLGQASGGTGELTFTGTMNLGGATRQITVDNSANTISGTITNGSLIKAGSGSLTLARYNFFSGFTLNAGTILVGNNSALGLGSVTINGGTLASSNATAYALGRPTTLGGDFTLGQAAGGTGALTLSGAMNLGGATRQITVDNTANTISGTITNGGLIKAGSGALTLSGSNSFAGGFTLNSGTIWVGHARALGAVANTVTINGGVLASSGGTAYTLAQAMTLGGDFTFGSIGVGGLTLSGAMNLGGVTRTITLPSGATNIISGVISNGGLTKAGLGTLTLSGNNTYSGDTTVSEGTVKLGVLNAIPNGADKGNVTVAGTLDLNAYSATFNGLGGSGIVDTVAGGTPLLTLGGNDQSSTFSGVIRNTTGTLSLTKVGTGTLALNGANSYKGITLVSGGGLTLGNKDALSGSTLDTAGAGIVSFFAGTNNLGGLKGSGSLDNGGNLLSVGANNQSTTYSGVLSGNGGLTKAGTGTLTLSGNNTFTGAFSLNAGTFLVGNANALATANAVAINGGVFASSDATAYTVQQATTVGGGFTLGQASGGTGSLTFTGPMDFGGGTRTIMVNNSVDTISGVISNGGLTKTGPGTLILGGVNTYNMNTTISSGTLQLGVSNAIPYGTGFGIVEVAAAGSIDLNTFNQAILALSGSGTVDTVAGGTATLTMGNSNGMHTTFAGVIKNTTGTLSLTKIGSSIQTLSGANTYSGNTTVSAGRLGLGADNAIPYGIGKGNVSVAGTLDLNGYNATINGLSGTGTVDGEGTSTAARNATLTVGANDQTSEFSGKIVSSWGPMTLVKIGTGTLTLSGYNTFSGDTLVSSGVLKLGHHNALSGSTLDTSGVGTVSFFAGTNNLGGIKGGGNLANGGNLLSVGANRENTTYSGVLSGFGGLTKVGTGTLTLSGANTYSGDTRVSGGTLALGNANALSASTLDTTALASISFFAGINNLGGIKGTGNIANGGRMLSVGANNQNTLLSGVMSGTGGLTKTGAGTLTLSGSNTYTGATMVSEGALVINGSSVSAVTVGDGGTLGGSGLINADVLVQSGGTLSPGNSPGLLTVGTLILDGGSTTEMQLVAIDTRGTTYDAINVLGAMTYGGTLTIDLNPDTITLGDYDLFNFDSQTGIFSTITFLDAGAAGTFNYSTGVLTLIAIPEPSTLLLVALAGFAGLLGRRKYRLRQFRNQGESR